MVVADTAPLSLSSSSSSPSSSSSSLGRSPPLPPSLSNSFTTRIFSDVAGDITIVVDGDSFLLHKFPLVARCGRIRKMVAEAKDSSSLSHAELPGFPGGPQTFELTMKFCYAINFEITPSNVVALLCAAAYLEMTEDYKEDNLISRTQTYLDQVAFCSLEKSVQVLCSCETLHPREVAENVRIPDRCVEAIAVNACKEQLVSGLSRLNCNTESAELKRDCVEWWMEDLSALRIDYYARVISAMARTGVRSETLVASLMHYAQESLKGIRNCQERTKLDSGTIENEQRVIVEAIVGLLPNQKGSSIPLSFLFGMLRVGVAVEAAISSRLELEQRIAQQLETVSLDDLLIPSVRNGDSLYDVDTVHRTLVCFLQRIEDEEDNDEDCGYESESLIGSTGHGSLLKVGRIVDAYLAEIAPDPYLGLHKFMAMIEILPDYARVMDDGLYRAIDIYLKAHPSLTDQECKKLCKFIDCQKLSQEACSHAAQNDRLPVQMAVRVLYSEQLRLKSALSSDSRDGLLLSSQKLSSGVPSGAVSPRDTYASLRRENRELKLEISRMRVRLSELEKEQMFMKQGMMEKPGNSGTFLTSLSRGIGRIGIFGGGPAGTKRRKAGRKSRSGTEGKSGRSRRHSVS